MRIANESQWQSAGSVRPAASAGAASKARVRLTLVLLALALTGCARESTEQTPTRPAADVLREYSDSLFAIPGVKGTGVTDWKDEEVIVVIVEKRETAAMDRIPARLEGHKVLVLDEEEIRRWGGL